MTVIDGSRLREIQGKLNNFTNEDYEKFIGLKTTINEAVDILPEVTSDETTTGSTEVLNWERYVTELGTKINSLNETFLLNTEVDGTVTSTTNSSKDIPGYISTEIYSNVKDQREEIKRKKEKHKEKKSILDLRMNDIIDNTVSFIIDFQKDYTYQLYKVDLESKMDNKESNVFKNIMKYFIAFFYHLSEKDNMLYFGIILIILSIILYLFNIVRE
mgnify:CR=1 FL=1|tara:strand:+ start:834 stop:1481 length:648 start_codon:yes stop_codon:yes gene_type:complete